MRKLTSCPACGHTPPQAVCYPEAIINICPGCRLQWAEMLGESPGTVRYNHYMTAASYRDPAAYPPFREFFAFARRRFGPRPLRLLDVGCGAGVFVGECLRRGHHCTGIEADARLRDRMDPRVADRIVFGLAERIGNLPADLDAICFWDSFEHLDRPFDLLERLNRHLAPGGFFHLRVNNSHDVYNLASLALLRVLPAAGRRLLHGCFGLPFHRWNFSVPGMTKLADLYKLEILACEVGETPAFRLTPNPLLMAVFRLAYAVNRSIGGGKIATVRLARRP